MKKNLLKKIRMAVVTVMFMGVGAQAQTIYYVKTNGTNITPATATSWATASNDLQAVINKADAGDKIFVAAGTYVPNRIANATAVVDEANKDNAFVLKNGVSIYGGFSATAPETNENSRTDIAGNATILSGDLNGDDKDEDDPTTTPDLYMTVNKMDNTYHVVIASNITATTVFDGFVVTKGYGGWGNLTVNGVSVGREYGAGVYILSCTDKLTISNVISTIHCSVGDESTKAGAGFYLENSSPNIDKCVISKCFNTDTEPKATTTSLIYGAGMSLVASSSPTITNTVFSDNFGGYGGALSINSGSPIFKGCTFRNNHVVVNSGRGGAVDIRNAFASFTNCLFVDNTAPNGGAVYNYSGRPTFINSVFYNNSCVFRDNGNGNGGAYGANATSNYGAVFINNTFYANQNDGWADATGYTAGVQVPDAATTTVTFTDNKTYFYNNLFYKNKFTNAEPDDEIPTPDIYVATPDTYLGTVTNNILQQTEYATYITAENNNQFNVNPFFISTTEGDMTFLAPKGGKSLAIDAGNDADNPETTDYYGNGRKNGTHIDIGAVEYYSLEELPVTLVNFTAKTDGNHALLQWQTANEQNNRGFEIYRRGGGMEGFVKIGNVVGVETDNYPSATNKDGQLSVSTHVFIDRNPLNGTNYYKLVQIDNDGKATDLGIRTVTFRLQPSTFHLYPNPTTNQVTVNWGNASVSSLKLLDLSGKVLRVVQPSPLAKAVSISLANYPAGTYMLHIVYNSGVETRKVVKL